MIEIGANNIYAEMKEGGHFTSEPIQAKRKRRTLFEWLADVVEIQEESNGWLSLQDSTTGELSVTKNVYYNPKTGYIYD